jgi:hypothetical protein
MGTLSKYMVVGGAPLAAQYVDSLSLASGVAETVTPDQGANVVLLAADADFWVRWDAGTATIPASDVTDGSAAEMNPDWRSLEGVTTFSVIADVAAVLTLAFYGTPPS